MGLDVGSTEEGVRTNSAADPRGRDQGGRVVLADTSLEARHPLRHDNHDRCSGSDVFRGSLLSAGSDNMEFGSGVWLRGSLWIYVSVVVLAYVVEPRGSSSHRHDDYIRYTQRG